MSKKLGMVAAGGLALGTVLLMAAAMVGGTELRNRNWDFGWNGKRCDLTLAGKRGTRLLDWNAGDDIAINMPANVQYRRGQGEQIQIDGDEALLPHVQIDDNDLVLDCQLRNGRGQRLTVTLPGQEFRRFAVYGSANLVLEDLDQSELEIGISGSGDVTASGRVEQVEFGVAGSGKGRFGNLDAGTVEIDIAGSGDVEVAPRDRLSVDVAGSGKVTLKTEPKSIDTRIAGSGRIIHPDGSVTRRNGLTRSSSNRDDI